VQERRERMVEELRKEERARDLLREIERRLRGGDHPELEDHLTQLDRLVESWPEGHMPRLLVESAVGFARTRDSIRAGSDREQVPFGRRGRDLDAARRPKPRKLRQVKHPFGWRSRAGPQDPKDVTKATAPELSALVEACRRVRIDEERGQKTGARGAGGLGALGRAKAKAGPSRIPVPLSRLPLEAKDLILGPRTPPLPSAPHPPKAARLS
jgi:hypothetical protein